MRQVKIDAKELKRLKDDAYRLELLEAGGVDNWDGYDDAMEPYRMTAELNERREEFLDDLMSHLAGGAYEPSERGAGFTFDDDSIDSAYELMESYGVIFKEEKPKMDFDVGTKVTTTSRAGNVIGEVVQLDPVKGLGDMRLVKFPDEGNPVWIDVRDLREVK